jgi:hypothetical protein
MIVIQCTPVMHEMMTCNNWSVPESRVSEYKYTITSQSSTLHNPTADHGASRRRHDEACSLIRLSSRCTRSFPSRRTGYTSCVGGDQDVRVEEGGEYFDLRFADF